MKNKGKEEGKKIRSQDVKDTNMERWKDEKRTRRRKRMEIKRESKLDTMKQI